MRKRFVILTAALTLTACGRGSQARQTSAVTEARDTATATVCTRLPGSAPLPGTPGEPLILGCGDHTEYQYASGAEAREATIAAAESRCMTYVLTGWTRLEGNPAVLQPIAAGTASRVETAAACGKH